MSSPGRCPVCWEVVVEPAEDEPSLRWWQCQHSRQFHADCARCCPTCPLCRAPAAPVQCTLRLGNTHGCPVTLDGRYHWPLCTQHPEREHHVVFSKPYGVVGRCQTCRTVRVYSWQG